MYPVLVIPEGVDSSDGRSYPPGLLTWRETVPLQFTDETTERHEGAYFVGNLSNFRRQTVDGATWIVADLAYDSDGDASEAERLAVEGKMAGVSADVAVIVEVVGIDEEGFPITDLVSAEIVGATQVPMPAFGEARILTDSAAMELLPPLVAAASALPPRDAFFMEEPDEDDPRYVMQRDGSVAIPLTFEGRRFYGHAGYHGACHTAFNKCVGPPESDTEYQEFHVNVTATDGGDVYTGPLLWRADHAPITLDTDGARDHYTHHAYQWGAARAVNGQHGIWLSGYVLPSVTDDELEILRQYQVSGDWRRGELIAALTVNRSAFTTRRAVLVASNGWEPSDPHLTFRMEGDEITALVASGVVEPEPEPDPIQALHEKVDTVITRLDTYLGFNDDEVEIMGDEPPSTGHLAAVLDHSTT